MATFRKKVTQQINMYNRTTMFLPGDRIKGVQDRHRRLCDAVEQPRKQLEAASRGVPLQLWADVWPGTMTCHTSATTMHAMHQVRFFALHHNVIHISDVLRTTT